MAIVSDIERAMDLKDALDTLKEISARGENGDPMEGFDALTDLGRSLNKALTSGNPTLRAAAGTIIEALADGPIASAKDAARVGRTRLRYAA